MGHKDYSSTPLWKKLGLSPGSRVLLVSPPTGFGDILRDGAPDAHLLARATRDLDVAVLFVTERTVLERRFPGLVEKMALPGRLWVAWPKKAARVETDLDFDAVQATGLRAGMVDNKSASITDVYQGLQFVRRLADR